MNEVLGLPAHPLLVHMPVVLIPLASVGVILILVRPRWRDSLLVPTAAIGIIGGLGAVLASQSGEWLQERVTESGLVHQHEELGEFARNTAILFALALFTWAIRELLVERPGHRENRVAKLLTPKWIGTAAAIGSLLFGGLATFAVVRAGHSGAKAAWDGKVSKVTREGSGER